MTESKLDELQKELDLKDIEAIHKRAEEYAINNRNKFDLVTSRAVANIEKLTTYTMHLLNKDGVLIALKGNIDEELTEEVKNKISKKYKIIKIEKFLLPIENSNRSIVIMKNM